MLKDQQNKELKQALEKIIKNRDQLWEELKNARLQIKELESVKEKNETSFEQQLKNLQGDIEEILSIDDEDSEKIYKIKEKAIQLIATDTDTILSTNNKEIVNLLEEYFSETKKEFNEHFQKKLIIDNMERELIDALKQSLKKKQEKLSKLLVIDDGNHDNTNKFTKLINNNTELEKVKAEEKKLKQEIVKEKSKLEKEFENNNDVEEIDKEIDEETKKWENNWELEKLSEEVNIQNKKKKFLSKVEGIIKKGKQRAKDLVEKILELKWKLISKKKEIKKLKAEIEALEKKLKADKKELKDKIKDKKNELERKKTELEKNKMLYDVLDCVTSYKIKETVGAVSKVASKAIDNFNIFNRKNNSESSSDENLLRNFLEDLLQAQEDEIRHKDDSDLYKQEKEGLINKVDERFQKGLRDFCQIQEDLIKLKMQLENIDRKVRIVYNHQSLISGGNFTNAQFSENTFSCNTMQQDYRSSRNM